MNKRPDKEAVNMLRMLTTSIHPEQMTQQMWMAKAKLLLARYKIIHNKRGTKR